MINPVQMIGGIADTISVSPVRPAGPAGVSFSEVLGSAVGAVENARADANTRVQNFLSGEGEDLHSVILATQKAELSFELFQQVRNKVVQAYQEVMRMQM